MGIGMQIVYLGFAGSAAIEAEAGVQLLRLGRYGPALAGCHLAIELLRPRGGRPLYDVRLDLISDSHVLRPIGHCESDDPQQAVRDAFDAAEKELRLATAGAGVVRRDH
ncbi:hypothetical protein [Paraburkholderia caballeronis]|uniref:hypothetical protein n=1 Tax=Paraburkholderia caballeronis TaxID=416943 RepID=UPI0010653E7B|nr:hypothetical protein [Paraburkholderia caballeronis]TDV11372.1 hypothetical protein C7408_11220 [Paraburkholderia caballeronis]TDV14562.1 hypothetical protein C7406_11320 [Paraburkholderia caballeronis]TDV23633.1 hypothetical protein C7404_11220 [Paraburkholderia caballeronis]